LEPQHEVVTGPPSKPPSKKKPVDISPRVCKCDGSLVERVEALGVMCMKCGRRKVAGAGA
jgi:hypothetical protein